MHPTNLLQLIIAGKIVLTKPVDDVKHTCRIVLMYLYICRDHSDGMWNESQATVLQVDSGTENGTVIR